MSQKYWIDAQGLAHPPDRWELPILIVDLDATDDEAFPATLPPVPLIGVGASSSCRLGAMVDLCVAATGDLEAIIDNVEAQPQAAAVAVQLLRLIENLDMQAALVAESLAYGILQGGAAHEHWLAGRSKGAAEPPGDVGVTREDDSMQLLLDRPWAGNAIDRPMRDRLREAFELAALDATIERVELRGAGKAFSLGADLDEFGTTRDPLTAHMIRMQTLPAHAIARCAERLHVHVQGACVGAGLEMTAFAQHIIAGPRAWFQLPELKMGLIPGAGGCVSVARRIGRQCTAWMILSGRRVSARTALDWGLIDAIVDD